MSTISPEELSRLTMEQKRALLKRLLSEKAAAVTEYPLSYGQRALWFVHKLLPDSPAYNVAVSTFLRQPLDTSALERSLLQLVDRHPALRTIFIETDDDPLQRISRPTLVFRRIDVSAGEMSMREQVLEEYRRPFDITQALFRVTLFQGPSSQVLLLNIHHLIFDAWSAQILIEDLCKLYEGQTRNMGVDLPLPQARYSDFVSWQRQMMSTPQVAELSNYWAGILAGTLPALRFPSGHTELLAGGHSVSIPISLDGELVAALRQLSRAHHATMYVIMLAAFQVLLHRYTGQDDIIIGSPASGRNQPRWQGVIGNFINMLPIRSNLSDNPTFVTHLARTRESVLGSLAHQDFPFPLMIERLRASSNRLESPLIQAVFNLVASPHGSALCRLFTEDQSGPGVPFGDTTLEPFPIPQQEGQFGLVLEAMEVNGTVTARLKCSPGGPDPELAGAMARGYRSLLAAIVANPTSPIDDLVLPGGESMELHRDVILL